MIIASEEARAIGMLYKDQTISLRKQLHYNQPIFVIRRATKEEWIAGCLEEFGITAEQCQKDLDKCPTTFFYEVSTD